MSNLIFIGIGLERLKITCSMPRMEVVLLTVVFMWAVNDSFQSKVTPRYFIVCDQEM